MSNEISIRTATSLTDRLLVLAVSHAAFRVREPILGYQAFRLANLRRARAAWWVLEVAGAPCSSLLCYPLTFGRGTDKLHGFGIGSVASAC